MKKDNLALGLGIASIAISVTTLWLCKMDIKPYSSRWGKFIYSSINFGCHNLYGNPDLQCFYIEKGNQKINQKRY